MSKPKFKLSAETVNNIALIKIQGYIDDWRNSAPEFEQKINEFIAAGIKDLNVYINCPGGNVFQANEIYNLIKKFPGTRTAELGALCASAATIIACACQTVTAAKNTMYMIHKPSIEYAGNEDDIESSLNLLKSMQDVFLTVYSQKTGLTKAAIAKLWKNDYWMNADEALLSKFIDAINDETEVTQDDISALYACYTSLPTKFKITATLPKPNNPNQNQSTMLKLLIPVLALEAGATEAEVTAAISILKAKAATADQLKSELDTLKATAKADKITAMLDTAVKEKKITAEQKTHYKILAEQNFETTEQLLKTMTPVVKLSTQTSTGEEGQPDRSNWTYQDYLDKEPKALQAMSKEDEPKFKALAEAHYGKKF